MASPTRSAGQIPGWVLVPILIFGVGGGFLVWERAQPEARQERALEAMRDGANRAFAVVDPKVRAETIEGGLAGVSEMEDPSAMMLTIAVWNGDHVAVRQLLGRSSRESLVGKMWMMDECFRQGDVRMVRTLLECGVPAQTPAPVRKPIAGSSAQGERTGEATPVEEGVGRDYPPLIDAIRYRSVDGCRLLLHHGADPDRRVRYGPEWIAGIVKGEPTIGMEMDTRAGYGSPSGGGAAGGRFAPPTKITRPENAIYTIRQLGLRSHDPAIRAYFQSLPVSRRATRAAASTPERGFEPGRRPVTGR